MAKGYHDFEGARPKLSVGFDNDDFIYINQCAAEAAAREAHSRQPNFAREVRRLIKIGINVDKLRREENGQIQKRIVTPEAPAKQDERGAQATPKVRQGATS